MILATSPRVDQLLWRINRLRCMTLGEIAHRTLRLLKMHAECFGSALAVPPADLARCSHDWIHVPSDVSSEDYLAAADRLLGNRLDVFALEAVDLGSPPRWNTDPKTGVEAPLVFGKLLDYRNPKRVGDIKYLWEPNRHLHLVTLAQAYVLSDNASYLATLREHLESWFFACPYGKGANWASALEPAIRLINWSVVWQLLGGLRSPAFDGAGGRRFLQQWLDSVYCHCSFVHGHFSLHSSANNHLLGEAAGLYIAALTWPHWPRSGDWQKQAKAILEREALLQNAPDGVNREQAVSYQQWELDLLLLPLLAGRANSDAFSQDYAACIEAMLEYLASIMDVSGNLPMFGDADDGRVIKPAPQRGFCPFRSLLATGAVMFRRGDFKVKAGGLDDKTRWLLGDDAKSGFEALSTKPYPKPMRRTFSEGGYYILGCAFETPAEIRLVADAGPLGYQTIAAHGHADALSFTLSVGGREFFIDPGTYAYHTENRWRRYFRGTAAHNTVRIDGLDQSQQGGNFMWLRKASAACERWSSDDKSDVFQGWQDGYARLSDPVKHRRRIVLDKRLRKVLIVDMLEAAGEHEVELFFHCSERCQVRAESGGYAVRQDGQRLLLTLPALAEGGTTLYWGSEAPIAGWVSRRYDVKRPAPTLVWRARLRGNAQLLSEIRC